jgi:thioredoxin reductase (NADPH)
MADKGSAVTVVIRGAQLGASMSGYLVRRLESHPHIDVLADSHVVALEGEDVLQAVQIEGPGGRSGRPCSALFSFIGADPQSRWLSGCAALDEHGFVLTDRSLPRELLDRDGVWSALGRAPLPYETSHPGLFAVGDVRSGSAKRVATAVGEGSAAVRAIHEYLAFTSTPAEA